MPVETENHNGGGDSTRIQFLYRVYILSLVEPEFQTTNFTISSPGDYLALSPLFVDIDLLIPLDAKFYALSPRIFS